MPQLPLPPQLSTDPNVNASAMAWAGQLVDALQKILTGSTASGVNADKLDGIDSLGFLKLLTAADHKVNLGTATLTWPGGAALSNILTIAHGLGSTPVWFHAFSRDDQGGGIHAINGDGAPDATNIKVRAQSLTAVPANPSSTTVYWIAIS